MKIERITIWTKDLERMTKEYRNDNYKIFGE